jgi:integrase
MQDHGNAKRRTRVEPGIYTRSDGRLEIGFRDSTGRLRWQVVDGGIAAARKQLTAAKAQRDRGDRIATDTRLTFNRAADAWLAARVARLRPQTGVTYRAHLVHLRDRWGRTRLSAITPADVAAYVAELDRGGAAGWTQRARLDVLSGVFTYAGRHLGHTGVNPVSLLDRVERPNVDDQREHRIVTIDELDAIIAAALPHHRLMLMTAAQTGMRKAEVLGLAWEDIDVARRTLSVELQLDRAGRRAPLKTKRSRRRVAIPLDLAAALAEHRLASTGDLVFSRRDGRPYGHRTADHALSGACSRAGIDPAPTWHDLRHSHVSMLFAAGKDPVAIAARVGDSIETVLRIYAHEYDAARRRGDESDELGAIYGNAVETRGSTAAHQTAPAPTADLAAQRAKRTAQR